MSDVNVPVKADDKAVKDEIKDAVKIQDAVKQQPAVPKGPTPPDPAMKDQDAKAQDAPRKAAKVRVEKRADQTVRGGMYAKPVGDHYIVVNAEGEVIPGKMVVDGPNGTLEVVNA